MPRSGKGEKPCPPLRGGTPRSGKGENTMSLRYNKDIIQNAKILRRNMTDQEKKLWFLFLRQYKVRFQRQKTIGNYIVDFYCHRARLIVEIDGSQHYEDDGAAYDQKRTQALEELSLKVIRFSNREVDREFRAVCETIDREVNLRLQDSPRR